MSLSVKRNVDETWLDAVLRYAKPYGLEEDTRRTYECEIADGVDEALAAWRACYEWDVCDFSTET